MSESLGQESPCVYAGEDVNRFPYDQFAKHCFEPLLSPIRQFTQLPLEHPYRAPLMESLANLRVIVESRPSRTINEQELFMQLSPLYLEKIAAAEQVGEQRGEQRGEQETQIKIALKMLGEQVPLETIARLTELSIEQIQELQSQQE
jgi:hypothetical protein